MNKVVNKVEARELVYFGDHLVCGPHCATEERCPERLWLVAISAMMGSWGQRPTEGALSPPAQGTSQFRSIDGLIQAWKT